jgi:hypothetical protein
LASVLGCRRDGTSPSNIHVRLAMMLTIWGRPAVGAYNRPSRLQVMQYPVKFMLFTLQRPFQISGAEPVTDLLNPAKTSRRLAEQRANPIKSRELKKAAREAEFVFILGSFRTPKGGKSFQRLTRCTAAPERLDRFGCATIFTSSANECREISLSGSALFCRRPQSYKNALLMAVLSSQDSSSQGRIADFALPCQRRRFLSQHA